MTDLKDKLKNMKDKVTGETQEAVGKLTDNEELELKGKIQSAKADVVKVSNANPITIFNLNEFFIFSCYLLIILCLFYNLIK